jgi:glycerol 2-dehydrogenase (NADP+)
MNQSGNDPNFPKLADGSRDLDREWSYTQTWELMEALPQTGKAKAIGVANFSVSYLEKMLATSKTIPAVNQIENHPYLPQQEIVDFCKEKNIHVTAYSPLGSTGSPLFGEEGVKAVAGKHKVGPGTVLLSYHIARGSSVLAKSVTPSRIDENKKLVQLDKEDTDILDAVHLNKGLTRYIYPTFGVNLGFPDKQ